MKKLLSLLLASAVLLGLCSCGSTDAENPNSTSKNEKLTEENIAGTYKSVGLFIRDEYQLNENTTFDSTKGNKGTYRLQDKNSIYVKAKNDAANIWTRKGKFYYVTDENHLTKVYKKDKEYELQPTFDKNGRSNQSFEAGEGDQYNYTEFFNLYLKADGTYTAEYKYFSKLTFSYETEENYEGSYTFENDILGLTFKETQYPMILDDGKLYFDIYEKAEE